MGVLDGERLDRACHAVATAHEDYEEAIHHCLATAFAVLQLPEWDGRASREGADRCVDRLLDVIHRSGLRAGVITKKHARQFVGKKYHMKW